MEITPDRNYVCLCYGQADLQAKLNPAVSEQLNTFHHGAPRYFHAKPQDHNGLFIESVEMENHMDEELILLEPLADWVPLFGPKPIKMLEKNNFKLTCKQETTGYRLCIFYCIP